MLKVLGTKGTGGYRLVVTENAVFNGITNGSAQDAVTLLDTNKAVGHVSQEASALLATYARDALNGYSVAAEGRYLYIGVPGDSSKGESAGKVVVYEFNGITYDKISEISASDTDAGDAFGTSMVLNGDSLAISAPSCVNSNGTTGAMYIFARGEDGTWVQSLKITNPTSNTDFGLTMDYCGDILVVGTQNVSSYTYAFRISGTSYQMFNLTLIVSYLNQSSAEWSYYGQSVATDGTYIVVGAPLVDSIRVGTETISSAGMFFIYKVTETGVSLYSYATSEQNDLRLGYSVTAEDGLIAAAAVRSGDEDGMLSIYTTNMGSIDTVTKIDGITLSTLYSRTLKLKDGVLTLAGYSAENSAYTYTLGADGTWKQKDSCTSPSTSNKMFGFDTVRADSTIYVSDPASFLSGNLSVGVVYAFDNQDDYYRMTASGTTISVTFSDGTGLNDGKAVAGETIFAELFDSAGNLLSDGTAELADGVYKFNVTDGVEYVLKVRAAEGKACDYCVSVDGIVQTSRFVNLLDCSVSTPSGVGGVILAERPTSITLTLSEAVRADRISKESVQIFNGAEFISAESFTLSADGKTATFQFADSIVFYTSNLKYEIQTNDFCTVSGSTLSLENASAETGIAVYQQEISTVSVTQKLKAAEESTVLTWKFSEAVVEPSGGWSDAVTVSSTRNGVTTNVTANGTFSYTNNILTWSASADHYAQTDDVLTTKMDASKLLTASGVPLANLTQTADGFLLEASFTVNLNSSAETEIVIRKKSSISDVDAETASAAEVPANEAWVHEWNTIWVEVWGWVLSANNNGISTFTAEIAYDAALFTPFDAGGKLTFNWNSSAFDSVTVTAGESENTLRVTATTSRGDIGICGDGTLDGHTLVASIRFTQGTTRGGVAETFENGNVKPAKIGIGFVENSISIEDTSGITIEGNAEDVTDGLPTVYPVVYDLDNNGSITISDLIIFAKNYFKDTTSSTVTKCCDFDGNGTVTISDLILFAKNYFRSGDSVVMSTSLTSSWGVESEESPIVAAILPESESPNEITAILPQTYKTGVVLEDAGQIGNVFWRNTSAALCFAAPESTESEASETADLSGSVVDAAISELQFLDENENDEDEDDTINAILDVKLGTGLNFS